MIIVVIKTTMTTITISTIKAFLLSKDIRPKLLYSNRKGDIHEC